MPRLGFDAHVGVRVPTMGRLRECNGPEQVARDVGRALAVSIGIVGFACRLSVP